MQENDTRAKIGSMEGFGGDESMRTSAEKRAYSRGYAAGKKAVKNEAPETTPKAELSALLDIARTRCAHLEIELAQARVSRDLFKDKYTKVAD
jgi:hypothetical protein